MTLGTAESSLVPLPKESSCWPVGRSSAVFSSGAFAQSWDSSSSTRLPSLASKGLPARFARTEELTLTERTARIAATASQRRSHEMRERNLNISLMESERHGLARACPDSLEFTGPRPYDADPTACEGLLHRRFSSCVHGWCSQIG